MIGLGPHTMSTADWVFLGGLQVALALAAAFALWLGDFGWRQASINHVNPTTQEER
jgi:hypothetical protein